MLDIFEGNQDELIHFVEIKQTEIDALIEKYDRQQYQYSDNLALELWDKLISPLYKKLVVKGEFNHERFFKELTIPQKVIDVLEDFHGQVNNGGIYQFFWNREKDVLAVEQSLKEIGHEEMFLNYQKVRVEFAEKEENIEHLKAKDRLTTLIYNVKQFCLKLIGLENKGFRRTGFEHFAAGYDLMKETGWFNEYFGEGDNEKIFYQKKAEYILKNLSKMAFIRNDEIISN
jgi:Domain of unknown function (DUF4375)